MPFVVQTRRRGEGEAQSLANHLFPVELRQRHELAPSSVINSPRCTYCLPFSTACISAAALPLWRHLRKQTSSYLYCGKESRNNVAAPDRLGLEPKARRSENHKSLSQLTGGTFREIERPRQSRFRSKNQRRQPAELGY